MKVAEIFAELGFNIKDANLGDFVNTLSKLDLLTVSTALGLGSIYLALNKITTEAVAAAHSLSNFAAQTGLSSEELQRWQLLGQQIGVTAEDVKSGFEGIQNSLEAINQGQGNVAPFQRLGLNVHDLQQKFNSGAAGTREAILNIAAALSTASAADRKFFASQMGVNDAMMQFLTSSKLTSEALDHQIIMTDKQRDVLNALGDESTSLSLQWHATMNAFAASIAPILIGLVRLGQEIIQVWKQSFNLIAALTAVGLLIGSIFTPLLFTSLGIGVVLSAILVALGLISYYWNDIGEAASHTGELVQEIFNQFQEGAKPVIETLKQIHDLMKFSPIGFGAGLSGDILHMFAPAGGPGNSDYSQNKEENNLTVHVHGDQGGKPSGVIGELEEAWSRLTGRSAYQRKLKVT